MPDPVNSPETLTILQYALGIGAALGAAVAGFFGVRSKTRRNADVQRNAAGGVEWFFDGPIAKALETLQAIYREIKEERVEERRFADERNKKLDEQLTVMRDIENNTRGGPPRGARPTRRD